MPNENSRRPQVVETPTQKSRRKRISQLIPAVRREVVNTYRVMRDSERVAKIYGIHNSCVQDAVVNHILDRIDRIGPQPELRHVEPSKALVMKTRTA